jgi:hypothetical protein
MAGMALVTRLSTALLRDLGLLEGTGVTESIENSRSLAVFIGALWAGAQARAIRSIVAAGPGAGRWLVIPALLTTGATLLILPMEILDPADVEVVEGRSAGSSLLFGTLVAALVANLSTPAWTALTVATSWVLLPAATVDPHPVAVAGLGATTIAALYLDSR